MVHAEVEWVWVSKEQEVPERAGAVVAVDAVGVASRVYLAGLFAERAFDRAGPAGPIDAAESQHHGGDGAAEDEALPFEKATPARALGLSRRAFVNPPAVLLTVDAGAGDEDEAPENVMGRQSREDVAGAIYISGFVELVGGATG